MEFDLFISYSRKDLELVKVIKSRIETAVPGIRIWFDMTGIESGEQFEHKIISAIDRSNSVLFVISKASMQSENTKREIVYADNKGKKIMPVLIDRENLDGWFLFRFGDIDYTIWQKPEQVERLISTIKKNTQSMRKAREAEEAAKAKKIALKAQADYIASQIQKLQAQQKDIYSEMSEIPEQEAPEPVIPEKPEKPGQNPPAPSAPSTPPVPPRPVPPSPIPPTTAPLIPKKRSVNWPIIAAVAGSVVFFIFILSAIFSDDHSPEASPESKPETEVAPEPAADSIPMFEVVPDVETIEFPRKTTVPAKTGKTALRSESKSLTGYINGHEWVDLGLPSGIKWSTCNVGASSPAGYGNYFAWGEINSKSSYTESNCETYGKDDEWLRDKGYVDHSGNLTMSHDAARQNWGGTWRMPTKKEMEELKANTTITWTAQRGVYGCLVTSKTNGRTIFLPVAGFRRGGSLSGAGDYGVFWSSTPYKSSNYSACRLYFYSNGVSSGNDRRYIGQSVRAVTE